MDSNLTSLIALLSSLSVAVGLYNAIIGKKIEKMNDKVADHETRITVLEKLHSND